MDRLDRDSLYFVFLEVIRFHYIRTHELLEEIGVYHGQPGMLFTLNKQDGQSQRDLADKLNLAPATITVMLKRMEKSGLVERRQDPKDLRVSRVYLTDKGRDLCGKTNEVVKRIEEGTFNNFTKEEKIMLRRLLMQMKDNLQR